MDGQCGLIKTYFDNFNGSDLKKRLHDLEKTVGNNKGRWAWELLQNAKDSVADYEDGKVAIQIELDNDCRIGKPDWRKRKGPVLCISNYFQQSRIPGFGVLLDPGPWF